MNLNLIIAKLFFAHQQEASYFRKEVKFRYLLLEMKDKSVFFFLALSRRSYTNKVLENCS